MIKASAPTLFAGEGGFLKLGMVSAAGGITGAPGGTGSLSTKCWNLLGLRFFLVGNGRRKLSKGNERKMLALWGLGGEAGALSRSRLWKCGWFRKAVRGEMWWNLFSSNPCWVCHNNRFYFCGICRPLMGWVFTFLEMVPVPRQRFQHFFFGRLRSAAEPCQSGQQL